jgi:hypothetical protein
MASQAISDTYPTVQWFNMAILNDLVSESWNTKPLRNVHDFVYGQRRPGSQCGDAMLIGLNAEQTRLLDSRS